MRGMVEELRTETMGRLFHRGREHRSLAKRAGMALKDLEKRNSCCRPSWASPVNLP